MYALGLQRSFTARHYLTGGDWGPENLPHSHPYRVEIRLSASQLDEHGYLADLCRLEPILDDCTAAYREQVLNDLPEFEGLNPSIEHFARLFCTRFLQSLGSHRFEVVEVRIWENEDAWASFRETFSWSSG